MALKILVAGGSGAGKTTFVRAVSESRPIRIEAVPGLLAGGSVPGPRRAAPGHESAGRPVAVVDFGRITIRTGLSLYLFGTPGEDRCRFLWDELAHEALGAVVLADARRLRDCFPAAEYFERRTLPFLVAVNCFAESRPRGAHEIARALGLGRGTPVVLCDARNRHSGKEVLIRLVEHAGGG
ncbi:ATP/GTP-binding protein [Streptomyces sp. NPDC003077]|uniref:GTP-binding protein n=1 Tax=Streptomyces sp. NPDC003077 TaxID=3154443 RepID=UPI0033B49BB3